MMYVMFRFSLQWFGIGWVVIALAECTTIRVICGIPWQVNPNGWPCQGPLHVTPPIGIISLGAISLGPIALGANLVGANSIGSKFQWEKLHWNKISRAPRAMGSALAKTRLLAVWLGADGFLPVWLPQWCILAPMAGDPQRLATAGTTA